MAAPVVNMEEPIIRQASFTKLTHEITQVVYKDLHALLDSMSEMDSAERRTKLLDYTARARHHIIRLLAAVRWHMECSAFHSSAGSLAHVANTRTFNYALNADRLWHSVFTTLRGAAAHPSAVAYAGELLGPGMTSFRLPRFIEQSIDVDTRKRSAEQDDEVDAYMPPVKRGSRRTFTETEPEMRVRLETKFAIRNALPSGIVISNWNPDSSGVSVRIGLPNVWHADLVLNAPDSHQAYFVILEFKLLIRTHVDAIGSIRRLNPLDDEPLPMTTDHYNYLRNMMQDRMAWAAHDVKEEEMDDAGVVMSENASKGEVKTEPNTERDNGMEIDNDVALKEKASGSNLPLADLEKCIDKVDKSKISRSDASLRCFCIMMTREICTTLVMDYVREQATQLALHPAWRKSKLIVHGIGSKAGPLVPVTVDYWRESTFPASVTVSVPKDEANTSGDWPNTTGNPDQVVVVSHHPPLPTSGNPVALNLRRVNMESLCVDSARRRAQHILAEINHTCKMKTNAITRTVLATHGVALESLVFDIGNTGFGLYLSMSLRTAGFRVRIRGGTSFALQQRVDKSILLRRALWKGERHFPGGIKDIERAVQNIIALLTDSLQLASCVRQTAMVDEGALLVWPPGAAAVDGSKLGRTPGTEIRPPFLPVEKHRPVRFLAMQSWLAANDHSAVPREVPASKRNRTSPVNFTTAPDGFVFVQGKLPHDLPMQSEWHDRDMACRAESGARWAQLRYATEMRFRRDRLLRELQINAIAVAKTPDYELRSSERTLLALNAAEPLPVARAVLVLFDQNAWRVEIVLEEDMFDDDGVAYVPGVRYCKTSRTLVFAYAVADGASVRRFGEDLTRARGTSALVRGVRASDSKMVTVRALMPTSIVTEAMGTVVAIRAQSELGRKVAIGARGYQFDVVIRRKRVLHSPRFTVLLAEVLNDNKENAGYRVLPLLERAIPVIAAAEKGAVVCPNSVVKLRTALRIMIEFKVQGNRCALDIDARAGRGRVQVADLARIREVAKAAGHETNPRTAGMADIPSWDAMVKKLATRKHGLPVHRGAAVVVPAKILETIVELIVGQGT